MDLAGPHPAPAAGLTAREQDPDRPVRAPLVARARLVVVALAALAALGGAAAGAQPTASAAADAALAGAFAGVATLAGSRARPWALLAAALAGLVTTLTAPSATPLLLASLATVLAAVTTVMGRRRPEAPSVTAVAGAASAACAAQALLRLPDTGPFGATAAVAGAALAVLAVSGFRHATRRTRRWSVALGLLALAAGTAVAAVAGLALVDGVRTAKQGLDRTDEGLETLRTGEAEAAAAQFDQASERFGDANDVFRSSTAELSRVVPVLAQHHHALVELSAAGADLSANAADTARLADYPRLRVRRGALPIEELAAMAEPLSGLGDDLVATGRQIDEAQSPWLLAPLADQLDGLAADLAATVPEVELAEQAARTLPDVLGASGARRYLVLLGAPGAARPLGGEVAAYAVLEADGGQLEVVATGSAADLRTPDGADVASSPDLGEAVAAATSAAEATGLGPVDGVVWVDTIGMEALLELAKVDADDLAGLLVDELGAEEAAALDADEALEQAVRITFEELLATDLPGPRRLGAVLGPAVAGGHLAVALTDPDGQALVDAVGAGGRVAPTSSDEWAAVRLSDVTPAPGLPLESRWRTDVDHRSRFDPDTGQVEATTTVTIEPADRPGEVELVVASPFGDADATIDGQSVALTTEPAGRGFVHRLRVAVPETGVVVALGTGGIGTPGDTHRVAVSGPPSTDPPTLRLEVEGTRPVVGGEGLDVEDGRGSATSTDGGRLVAEATFGS